MGCHCYVEVVRNTPLLVQLFVVFFGLPSLGVKLGAGAAALVALSVNLGAYATEIIRAGVDSVHKSQVEAGLSLGLTNLQVFRHIVLYQASKVVYPALASQFILLLLATSSERCDRRRAQWRARRRSSLMSISERKLRKVREST